MEYSENLRGEESLIVQNYGIDSLVTVSSIIQSVRKYQFRHETDSLATALRAEYKLIQQYPMVPESTLDSGFFNTSALVELYGNHTHSVLTKLKSQLYCQETETGEYTLTWRFRNLGKGDFDIEAREIDNSILYNALEPLLWVAMPQSSGVDAFLEAIMGTNKQQHASVYQIDDTEYWYRQGLEIIAFQFSEPPSPELLSLLSYKLQTMLHEKMQNYFHVLFSYNADDSLWMREKNRRQRFFEIIGNFLAYSWRLFDMKNCAVSIRAEGDERIIASGTLNLNFSDEGVPHVQFDPLEKEFIRQGNGNFDFAVNDVALRPTGELRDTSFLNLRLVSRSAGNVDPRWNISTHRFVKLFIESVVKLIDFIMPVIRREEVEKNLRWRYFLDSMRLRAMEYGENLHLILTDFIRFIQKFFGVGSVQVFSEDRDFARILERFYNHEQSEKVYRLIKTPISPTEILRQQLLLIRLRDIPNGLVFLYIRLAQDDDGPSNPENAEHYLQGTPIFSVVNEEAKALGIPKLKDYLFFLISECVVTNSKAVITNVSRRLLVKNAVEESENFNLLTRRVIKRFSMFLDFFHTLSGSIESGLAFMKGRWDNLTGLYNRQHFTVLQKEAFAVYRQNLGLIFFDMDNFKFFNDVVSHDFGDRLLMCLADRLSASADKVGLNAVPGRFGGDEFSCFISGLNPREFESHAIRIFRSLTIQPLWAGFHFDDRIENDDLEVNLIFFLHRLMRPDVGSRHASFKEYTETANIDPRNHILDIWKHYWGKEHREKGRIKIAAGKIVDDIAAVIEDKILFNKMFAKIDDEFREIIRIFIRLKLQGKTTNTIRKYYIHQFESLAISRSITLKLSAGLAHSSENRIRSMESLFNAADSRATMAKLNGRNCLFGLSGKRLA